MSALTQGRETAEALGTNRAALVAAAAVIFQGGIVCRDAAGNAVAGSTATGLVGIGVATDSIDNSAGDAGDLSVPFRAGFWRFDNSAAADEITIADIGEVCFVVDDQTVAKTDGTGTRSPAGMIDSIDDLGVWVRFDEALTRAATA